MSKQHSDACCPRCTGCGQVVGSELCPGCAGQPFINLDGHTMVCEDCHGTGKQNLPCPECSGHHH